MDYLCAGWHVRSQEPELPIPAPGVAHPLFKAASFALLSGFDGSKQEQLIGSEMLPDDACTSDALHEKLSHSALRGLHSKVVRSTSGVR